MKKICFNSKIKKRYFHHTEDTFRDHPELVDRSLPSLEARQAILATAVPGLAAAAAAARAIEEWDRPASDVTHLVLATYSGAHMPGTDLRLARLLGLRHTAHLSLVLFRVPQVGRVNTLVMQALFGDGAAAVIVGAGAGADGNNVVHGNLDERPLFEMVSASQTAIPDNEDAAAGYLREDGLLFRPSPKMPALVRQHVKQCVADAVAPLGLGGRWNDLFWAVHPGGPAILDAIEDELALAPEKLAASRHVLKEYGNMSGS